MEITTAEALFQAGHFAEVERRAREALRATDRSKDPQWMNLLACSLVAQGRVSEAHELFKQLAHLEPGDIGHLLNLGNTYLEIGEPNDAEYVFAQARANGANGVVYLLGHGLALMAGMKFQPAQMLLSEAYALEPMAVDVRLAYAQCLAELEQFDRLELLVGSLDEALCTPKQERALAWLLAQAGLDERAVTLYRRLLALEPGDAELRVAFALLLERLNRLDEANLLLQGEDVDWSSSGAMGFLVRGRLLRRKHDVPDAIACLREGAVKASDGAMQAQLQFELAKCHEAIDQPDACMASLATAHTHAAMAFTQRFPDISRRDVLGWLDERIENQAPAAWSLAIGDQSPPDPVFLVGFPRSGTTLLERVLDAHPRLNVLDERPALEAGIARLKQFFHGEARGLDAALNAATSHELSAAREEYWREVRRHVAPHDRLVDKYPLYLTRVPYVARLFPQAAWLLLLRHPCDCVLSCHMQAFGLNGGALVFQSLESTAVAYASMMGHWTSQVEKAPMPVHALRYEDLIQDFHGELDRVMDFLSLQRASVQDDFSIMATRRNRRINTPSYSQVIRPINSSAVGRWRRYRKHFSQHALDVLGPWVERYGYNFD